MSVALPFRVAESAQCGERYCDPLEASLRNWKANWVEAGGAAVNGELVRDATGLWFRYFFTGESTGLPDPPIVQGWLPAAAWNAPTHQWRVLVDVAGGCLAEDDAKAAAIDRAEVFLGADGSPALAAMGIAEGERVRVVCRE